MPGPFCRTPCMHCSSHIQLNSEVQCRSSSVTSVTSSQCAWHVAHGQACLSGASHVRLVPSWHRWHPGPPALASSAAAESPVATNRRHPAAQHRSAPPKPPGSSAWPSPLPAHACSTVAVAWHAQGALFVADVPYGRSAGDRP